jgi:hypothetical protein
MTLPPRGIMSSYQRRASFSEAYREERVLIPNLYLFRYGTISSTVRHSVSQGSIRVEHISRRVLSSNIE